MPPLRRTYASLNLDTVTAQPVQRVPPSPGMCTALQVIKRTTTSRRRVYLLPRHSSPQARKKSLSQGSDPRIPACDQESYIE